jgi:cation transport regulator
MPYRTNEDLPESVRKSLPSGAQDIYRAAYDFADRKHPEWDENRKHQYAWGAVKTRYHQATEGRWVKND